MPDNELISLKERAELVDEIKRVSDKPVLVDIDTGGQIEHLPFNIKEFEKAGAWGVVMEDKKHPKHNSLLDATHSLEDVDVFVEKIRVAKEATKNMKVFARLESLIAKRSMFEALIRASAYVKAGADGIVIHSKEQISCTEVMEFAKEFKGNVPLIAIPTTYTLPEEHPFDIVIRANHMLRASIRGMENYLKGKEDLATVEDIFKYVCHEESIKENQKQ